MSPTALTIIEASGSLEDDALEHELHQAAASNMPFANVLANLASLKRFDSYTIEEIRQRYHNQRRATTWTNTQ